MATKEARRNTTIYVDRRSKDETPLDPPPSIAINEASPRSSARMSFINSLRYSNYISNAFRTKNKSIPIIVDIQVHEQRKLDPSGELPKPPSSEDQKEYFSNMHMVELGERPQTSPGSRSRSRSKSPSKAKTHANGNVQDANSGKQQQQQHQSAGFVRRLLKRISRRPDELLRPTVIKEETAMAVGRETPEELDLEAVDHISYYSNQRASSNAPDKEIVDLLASLAIQSPKLGAGTPGDRTPQSSHQLASSSAGADAISVASTEDAGLTCTYCGAKLLGGEMKRAARDRLSGKEASCDDCLEHL